MERRKHRRVSARVQGFFLGNSHEVEGHTVDLSLGGAQIEGRLDVYAGKIIRLRLIIPGFEEPLNIDEARVRWVGEETFGVEFQNVRPTALDELEQLIDEFDELEAGGHA